MTHGFTLKEIHAGRRGTPLLFRNCLNLFVQAIGRGFGGMARRFPKEDSQAIFELRSTKTRNSPRRANKILKPLPENPAFSGWQEISNSFLESKPIESAANSLIQANNPKSVIRHAVSVSDWENEASGHLARFCPHPVSRYPATPRCSPLRLRLGQKHAA